MNDNTDLPHQADTLQQQSPPSFKQFKVLALIVAVLLSALVAGLGAYLLRINRRHSPSLLRPSHQRPSVDSPPPVTPGWKLLQFQSKEMHFTIQYPSTLSLENPSVEEKEYKPAPRILFNAQNPNGQLIGLSILYVTEDITNSHFLIGALLTAPIGNVPTENIENYGDNVITKIADLTINSHRAVHATFFRKGGIYPQPRFCKSYLILKDNNHYHMLNTCTTNAPSYKELQAKVTQYSSLMEQIVNTFTIK